MRLDLRDWSARTAADTAADAPRERT